jgi:hypothetical protein
VTTAKTQSLPESRQDVAKENELVAFLRAIAASESDLAVAFNAFAVISSKAGSGFTAARAFKGELTTVLSLSDSSPFVFMAMFALAELVAVAAVAWWSKLRISADNWAWVRSCSKL